MFKFNNGTTLVFCFSLLAFASGCGATATVTKPRLDSQSLDPHVEAKALRSTIAPMYVDTLDIDRLGRDTAVPHEDEVDMHDSGHGTASARPMLPGMYHL